MRTSFRLAWPPGNATPAPFPHFFGGFMPLALALSCAIPPLLLPPIPSSIVRRPMTAPKRA